MYERVRKEKIVETKIQRLRNAMGMMDTIVTFQNGAWHARHAGCYRKFQDGADLEPTHRSTTSFLDFSRLEHAQATHEHTEQPTTQLESVSFVDVIT